MNIVVATSRGKAVFPLLEKSNRSNNIPSRLYFYPGAKYTHLTTETLRIIENERTPNTNIHVYILGGLPDLTKRLKNNPTQPKYEEVIMEGNAKTNTERIMKEITTMYDKISRTGAKIIICPIVPSNISKWNYTRLTQHKTLSLKQFGLYPEMQHTLHQTVTQVNKEVTILNSSHNLRTPFINRSVITSFKVTENQTPKYKFSYNNFQDGVHPNRLLAQIWCDKLSESISKNFKQINPSSFSPKITVLEKVSDSEDELHSRSWRPS